MKGGNKREQKVGESEGKGERDEVRDENDG